MTQGAQGVGAEARNHSQTRGLPERRQGALNSGARVFLNDGAGVFTDSGQVLSSGIMQDVEPSVFGVLFFKAQGGLKNGS